MVKITMTDPSGREKEYEIGAEPQVFGRGEDSDVILGSRSVERHHMSCRVVGGKVMIEDLTEGRGLLLDGESKSGTFELVPGAEMEAGVFLFQIPLAKDSAAENGDFDEEQDSPPILQGTRGPTQGLEVELKQGDNDIGRDPSLFLVIDDPSISRLHARLTVGSEQVSLTDMRSSNGTLVNGKRINTAVLTSGDLVRFGKISFRFLHGDNVSKGAKLQKKKKLLLFAVAAIAALVLLVVVVLAFSGSGQIRTKKVAKPKEIPIAVLVERHLTMAQMYMKKGQWQRAIEELDELLKLHPISVDGRKRKKVCEDEMRREKIYNQGRSLLDIGKLDEALDEFQKIDKKSYYYKKVKYLTASIRKRLMAFHLKEAKSFYEARQFKKAHQHFLIYMDLSLCDEAVEKLIHRTERKMKRFRIKFKTYTSKCTEKPENTESAGPLAVLRVKYPHDAIFSAVKIYFTGKAELAIPKLRRLKRGAKDAQVAEIATRLEREMLIVAAKFSSGTTFLLSGNLAAARESFNAVLEIDGNIVPSRIESLYRKNIKTQLSARLHKLGVEKFGRKHWVDCYGYWKECLEVNPDDIDCKEGTIKLEEVAQEALEAAEQREGRGQIKGAVKLWRLVKKMTHPRSLPYNTADLKLKENKH